jgi:hypothetical protein
LLKGKAKVCGELGLFFLAYNLRRMITILDKERLKKALSAPFWDLQAGKEWIGRSLVGWCWRSRICSIGIPVSHSF